MKQLFVFIYAKGKKIKALSLEDSKTLRDTLLKDGWKHTQTLDACIWIQHLHNDCKFLFEIDRELKSLRSGKN